MSRCARLDCSTAARTSCGASTKRWSLPSRNWPGAGARRRERLRIDGGWPAVGRIPALKVKVQALKSVRSGQTVGQAGETASVTEQQRRFQSVDIAAPNMSGKYALASRLADIGVQESSHRLMQNAVRRLGRGRARCA